jgi:hypothetical protein
VRPADWPDRDQTGQQSRIDRAWHKLTEELTKLRATLESSAGRTARLVDAGDDGDLPRVELVVDGSGTGRSPGDAVAELAHQHDELRQAYDDQMHRTLHELLGSAFIEHLRDRLAEVERLEHSINHILAEHPTGTTRTTLRIRRAPFDGDKQAADVLAALQQELSLLSDQVQEQVRFFLRTRVEAQQQARAAGESDWRSRLAHALDYREWFDIAVEKRTGGGRWAPLSRAAHAELSGGARVVTLMLPLIAALAATFQTTPTGPRPLWLDEALDGVDAHNRATVLDLLRQFDMDYLLVGPAPLVTMATVPCASLYEVVRAEHPMPGADLTLMLWAAGTLHVLDLPDPARIAADAAGSANRASGDDDDLLSAAGL